MSGFSADWLALREPADVAARSEALARAVAESLGRNGVALRAVDLGAGTGANVRFLLDALPADQNWLLIDQDETLLSCVPGAMSEWAERAGYRTTRTPPASIGPGGAAGTDGTWTLVLDRGTRTHRIRTRCIDLIEGDVVGALLEGCALVTASALLDLVSPSWIQTLAEACVRQQASVLFALSYDGRIACQPAEPEDELIRALVNRHQRTDKGFGRAAGPEAASTARAAFTRLGYDTDETASDWVVTEDQRDLQRALLEGWAGAALALAPQHAALIERWTARRLEHVAAGRSRLIVGHVDLAGWPRPAPAA